MSLLSLQSVEKSYFGRVILNGVSLRLDRGDRLALIGENGAGKTTLLRLLAGREQPDQGQVCRAGSVIVGYLSQHVEELFDLDSQPLLSQEQKLLEAELHELEAQMARAPADRQLMAHYTACAARFEASGGYDHARHMQEALAGLGLTGEILTRPLSTLSGGERMRVALARILLTRADVLLLDEPTNHLDAAALEWLASFLNTFKGAVLFVSHDRAFIDQVATAVAQLQQGHLTVHPGQYSQFTAIEASEQAALDRTIRRMEKDLAHQTDVTQTMLSHRNMESYHAREKVVARLTSELQQVKDQARLHQTRLNFRFLPVPHTGAPNKQLLLGRDLSVCFPDRTLFHDVQLEIRGQDKICICGPNGCGKSTLLNLLRGEVAATSGTLQLAEQAVFGYMGQHVEFKNEQLSLLEELLSRFDLDEGRARSLLARYGFCDVAVYKTIAVLSGGERARLYLCCLLLEQPDLLLLDEPTNHLDIQSGKFWSRPCRIFPGPWSPSVMTAISSTASPAGLRFHRRRVFIL
jgi:ATP-binding cassette subfamily F protein 3